MDSTAKTAQAKMHSVPATGTETSTPASSPALTAGLTMAAPKFGTLVPNRIFVGGISANTSEAELAQLFSAYGHVKATKIIADRGGVSKGYGFVTFETEEEAKRLQQESECIVLRERKLNIAPAIKKQPFNRSFDGGTGSPPTVPTSTYYYPNGVGLPYQNGMAFYSAGAPAPGPGIVPPSDPSLYPTAGVFGPQGAASHQTFAPMMYPVPAPSIYMPQQYQYSPMPYEPYYTGTTANPPQFMYATTNNSSNNNSNNSGVNNLGNRNNNTGTTSPQTGIPAPSLSSVPPSLQTHFYTPAATTHPLTGIPAGSHPPQIDHLYYSYTTGPPGHGPIGLAAEQQLLLYTTEISNQPSLSESQINPQDDSQSASSHSEQLQGDSQTAQISSDTTAPTPLVPLIPFKYPVSNQYPNYPTFSTVHSSNIHNPQNVISDMNESNSNNQIDYRTAVVYPAQVYLPQHPRSSPYHTSHNSTSLLPTPISTSQPSYDLNVKVPIKPGVNSQNPYVKGNTKSNPLINSVISPNIFNKTPPNMPNYPYNKYPPVRLSGQQQQQYPKRNFGNVPLIASPSSSYFIPQKSCHLPMNMNNRYFTVNNHNSHNPAFNKVNFSNKNFFPNNSNQRNSNPNQNNKNQNSTSPVTSSSSVNEVTSTTNINSEQNAEKSDSTVKSCTPTKITQSQIPFSPTNPAQNLSSPNPQVQFYPTVQSNQRYQSTSSSNVPHHHQQQANQRHRYQANNSSIRKSMNDNNKFSSGSTNNQNNIIRQTKYKMNGMIQSSGKLSEENNLGGAGDASSMNRLPMTPPGTPRNNQTSNDQTQLVNETCHQMQALGL